MEKKISWLTESGIRIKGGETITEGKVLEIVKEAERLWDIEDDDGFMALFEEGSVFSKLSGEDQELIMRTAICGHSRLQIYVLRRLC
jgi:hypothetical protein